jgi:hypothetical protein
MVTILHGVAHLVQSDSKQPRNIDLRYAVVRVLVRDDPQITRHRRYLAQWLT